MTTRDTHRPLFDRFPALAEKLPFTVIGELPTPVEEAGALANHIGVDALTVKRDDVSAALYGGNKVRKLEFLLADAVRSHCHTVLTFGGLGSNHALATSIYCRRLGLRCAAILTPEPVTDKVRRTLAYHAELGTRIEMANDYSNLQRTARDLQSELGGEQCYLVPFGGSSWVGVVGFVNAALELGEQVSAGLLSEPDAVYLACGTTGSVVGLAIGLRVAGMNTRIEGVQVTPDSMQPDALARRLFDETCHELHSRDHTFPLLDEPMRNLVIRNDQLGRGYAIPTEAAEDAAGVLEALTGLPASLTYTGKALAALVDDSREGRVRGKRILFWNTYNSRPYPELDLRDRSGLPPELARKLG